jgi:copper(I)-binding protein
MKTPTSLLLAAVCALAFGAAQAHDYTAGALKIGHPWARSTVPGQANGGAYLKLQNGGSGADKLLSASTPAAERVELHSMSMDGDVMRMREVGAIEVPPAQTVELKPGALHLMLVGLKAPLQAGTRVPLTLRFQQAGEVKVELAVQAQAGEAATPASAPGHDHSH